MPTSRPRRRAVGAGAKHKLVSVDRLLATLAHLRHGATHDMLACWLGGDRSTIARASGVFPAPGRIGDGPRVEAGCWTSPGLRSRPWGTGGGVVVGATECWGDSRAVVMEAAGPAQ
ncbi:transposase family protein [Streptomyces sp. 2131.1]|uniref:helix-turn-helix domain-containing protein n=1 Tax=Streptomyces sp. 2131.1 TaxID=1855346 RepID=UPI00210D3EA1|nr:transposase family protein [Streptomyces sp. 2131.1]